MPLEGHWQRQHASRSTDTPRERRVALAIFAGLLACVVAITIAAVTSGSQDPAPGCLKIGVASTTGGAMMNVCGTKAEQLCRGESTVARDIARKLPGACRRAGLT